MDLRWTELLTCEVSFTERWDFFSLHYLFVSVLHHVFCPPVGFGLAERKHKTTFYGFGMQLKKNMSWSEGSFKMISRVSCYFYLVIPLIISDMLCVIIFKALILDELNAEV